MDTSFLDDLCARKPEKAAQFAKLTLADIDMRLPPLKAALEAGNAGEAVEYAHAMKSVAGQAGAADFSETCKRIEGLCRDGKAEEAGALIGDLYAGYDEIKDILRRYIDI